MNTRDLTLLLAKSIASGNLSVQLPEIFQQGIIYLDVKRSHLAKLDEPVKFNGKVVHKMQLIRAAADISHPPRDVILLHFHDAITPFSIHPRHAEALQTALISLGACEETLFSQHKLPTVNWHKRSQRDVYAYETVLAGNHHLIHHYDDLHARLITRLSEIIQTEPHTPFNIVDGGCGDGSLLKKIEALCLPAKLAGFDLNAMNLVDAYAGEAKQTSSYITIGNLLDTDKIIAHLVAGKKLLNGGAKTIMLLSGSLTRRVLSNVYQALDVFTAIARQPSIHYVLGGGINEPLINRYFAKQMGFQLKPLTDAPHQYDFFYERMPRPAFAEMKLAKMHKKKLVDLSFCPDDTMLTTLLPYITDEMTIDLSFCHYSKAVERAVACLTKRFPTIPLIMRHTNAHVIHAFSKRFKSQANLISVQKIPANDELHLFNTFRKLPRYSFFDSKTQTVKAPEIAPKLRSRL